jgi:hypothetical protein
MRLLVACHDAGGAEIVSAWLRRHRGEHDATLLLEGPAKAIFAAKVPDLPRVEALGALDVDLVLCGSSGAADLERWAVRAARDEGVRSAVWLDHWTNYPARFASDGAGLVLPDEVWVTDEHAARLAEETLPGSDVRIMGNPYLDDAAEEIRALTEPSDPAGERVLYVTEPTAAAAAAATGDPRGWGYDEHEALAGYLEHLAREPRPPSAVRLRTHPAELPGKYDRELAALSDRLALSRSSGSLAEDCAWATTVAGCETMAMAVALAAGRRVVSVIPPGGRPSVLPFEGIERLHAPSGIRKDTRPRGVSSAQARRR